jgi:hypothetical protein
MSQSTSLEDRRPRRSTTSPLGHVDIRVPYVQLVAYVPYRVPPRGLTRHAYVPTSLTRTPPYPSQLTAIFSKTYGEDTFQCPYKDYSSLDRWQANRDLLSIFSFCNLLFCNDAHTQGKKVSILVLGDMDSDLVASRRGLLEAVPIVRRVTTAYPGRVET